VGVLKRDVGQRQRKSNLVHFGGGIAEWLVSRTSKQEGPGSNLGGAKKFSDGICKYLPLMSCSFVEIMHFLIVVSVCITG